MTIPICILNTHDELPIPEKNSCQKKYLESRLEKIDDMLSKLKRAKCSDLEYDYYIVNNFDSKDVLITQLTKEIVDLTIAHNHLAIELKKQTKYITNVVTYVFRCLHVSPKGVIINYLMKYLIVPVLPAYCSLNVDIKDRSLSQLEEDFTNILNNKLVLD